MAVNAKSYNTSGTTAAVHTGPVQFCGYTMANTTANAATIIVYNALTATSTVLLSDTVAANSSKIFQLAAPLYASVGITVQITGTTPNVVGSVLLD
jgi:hypothetical protein